MVRHVETRLVESFDDDSSFGEATTHPLCPICSTLSGCFANGMDHNNTVVFRDQNWSSGGIVIYHVDEMAPKQTARGYPGHPNWPTDHYQVAVLQADGEYSIEKGTSPGNTGHFWTKGRTLKSGGDLWPNSDSYQGGKRQATGIEITVTSDSQFIMSFTVSGLSGSRPALRFPTEDISTGIMGEGSDPDTTGGTITWILSMLGGVAAMIGVLIVVL